MKIRNLTKDDFFLLNGMDWAPLPRERDSIYLFLALDQGDCCFIAEENGSFSGVLLATRSSDGRSVYLNHLLVDNPARKKGVGTRLMERLHRYAVEAGVERIWLMAYEDLRAYYERLGYRESYDFLSPELQQYLSSEKKISVFVKHFSG
ncbi:MAG: GNAT family N-acetyltransferase [Candidatus Glassbacteria bacterium]|nr:GNAT family N-acetyltransferase [Candidatus Glassbacteria bacterium]